MRRVYCGGTFAFDYLNPAYRALAAEDYRAVLLGGAEALLQRSDAVTVAPGVSYVGPFYFESDGMVDADIVGAELGMVRECTDAVFLLDHGLCPGTVSELTVASLLGKKVAVFYVKRSEAEETESVLHSPCWYPITLAGLLNERTEVFPCESLAEAKACAVSWVHSLSNDMEEEK
jgi:hypothetical protein